MITVVVGFPCNDFGNQEPGDHSTIQHFCELNYRVSFPLTVKVHIKLGNPHPVYEWLSQKTRNGVMDAPVNWNFNKFLLDEKGHLLAHFPAATSPIDPLIIDHFEDS